VTPIFDEERIANMCASAACERWQVINMLASARVIDRDPLAPANVITGPHSWWVAYEKKLRRRPRRKPKHAAPHPDLFDGAA
jgi:hypothetical protein